MMLTKLPYLLFFAKKKKGKRERRESTVVIITRELWPEQKQLQFYDRFLSYCEDTVVSRNKITQC
jgi:hypothetical protein